MDFIVETSARHVHLCETDLETLFGIGATLNYTKELSQPGQYACEERVTIVGPKRSIEGVIILGPTRSRTQVEISLTDARTIGIDAPVRESGDVAGSASCTIVGPAGSILLPEGVIAAKRHIHIKDSDADALGVKDKEIVKVKVDSDSRSLVFGDVVIRINGAFATAMHIDTDESNAAGVGRGATGIIIK